MMMVLPRSRQSLSDEELALLTVQLLSEMSDIEVDVANYFIWTNTNYELSGSSYW